MTLGGEAVAEFSRDDTYAGKIHVGQGDIYAFELLGPFGRGYCIRLRGPNAQVVGESCYDVGEGGACLKIGEEEIWQSYAFPEKYTQKGIVVVSFEKTPDGMRIEIAEESPETLMPMLMISTLDYMYGNRTGIFSRISNKKSPL